MIKIFLISGNYVSFAAPKCLLQSSLGEACGMIKLDLANNTNYKHQVSTKQFVIALPIYVISTLVLS